MKSIRFCLILLIFWVGTACSPNNNATETTSNGCPTQPKGVLDPSNVKSIPLSTQAVKESGMVSTNKSVGYTFEAKAGQKLKYQTDTDICIWLYTPDNQLLSSKDLPQTGRYTIQVSAPKGSKTFELDMSLETATAGTSRSSTAAPASQSTETPSASTSANAVSSRALPQFSKSDYPKSVCGDPIPTDPNVYPINFYPVNTPYSEENLAKVHTYFCRDAFPKISKDTGEKVIQVVSFTNLDKARAFANLVNFEIKGATVGSPTTIYK